jgi:hypothetical protein
LKGTAAAGSASGPGLDLVSEQATAIAALRGNERKRERQSELRFLIGLTVRFSRVSRYGMLVALKTVKTTWLMREC